MKCPSCNKRLDLLFSTNKDKNFYQEYDCHDCQLLLQVKVYSKYHAWTNMQYNKKRRGHSRGFS